MSNDSGKDGQTDSSDAPNDLASALSRLDQPDGSPSVPPLSTPAAAAPLAEPKAKRGPKPAGRVAKTEEENRAIRAYVPPEKGRLTSVNIPSYKRAFLESFKTLGNIRETCEGIGIGRRNISSWLNDDPAFKDAFDIAKAEFGEYLEREAVRQAFSPRDKTHGPMLMFLMKAAMPEKYGDKPWQAGLHLGNINVVINIPRPIRDGNSIGIQTVESSASLANERDLARPPGGDQVRSPGQAIAVPFVSG